MPLYKGMLIHTPTIDKEEVSAADATNPNPRLEEKEGTEFPSTQSERNSTAPRHGDVEGRETGVEKMRGREALQKGASGPEQGRGREITQRRGRVRRNFRNEKDLWQRVAYNIDEWRRDSVLEMIGVNSSDVNSQYEYHRRQVLDPQTSTMCINRDKCRDMYQICVKCPNIANDDDYDATWGTLRKQEKRIQQMQWENYTRHTGKEIQSAGSADC